MAVTTLPAADASAEPASAEPASAPPADSTAAPTTESIPDVAASPGPKSSPKPKADSKGRKSGEAAGVKRPRRASASKPVDYTAQPPKRAPPPENPGVYEVLLLVDRRILDEDGNKTEQYKVRWKGYSKAYDTWEPVVELKKTKSVVWQIGSRMKPAGCRRKLRRALRTALKS